MFSSSLLLILALKMAAGLLADRVFGEVRRFHPLVGFGRWAGWVERGWRRLFYGANETGIRLAGVLAWALAVLPWVALADISPAVQQAVLLAQLTAVKSMLLLRRGHLRAEDVQEPLQAATARLEAVLTGAAVATAPASDQAGVYEPQALPPLAWRQAGLGQPGPVAGDARRQPARAGGRAAALDGLDGPRHAPAAGDQQHGVEGPGLAVEGLLHLVEEFDVVGPAESVGAKKHPEGEQFGEDEEPDRQVAGGGGGGAAQGGRRYFTIGRFKPCSLAQSMAI